MNEKGAVMEDQDWTIRHFSLTNPIGPSRSDIPALLRRVASTLEQYDDIGVQDVVFHNAAPDDDDATVTVYYHRATDENPPHRSTALGRGGIGRHRPWER
jgi:hypothetical protein